MSTSDDSSRIARRRILGAGAVGGAGALSLLAGAGPASAAATDAEFWSFGPTRVVDSRSGLGTTKAKIRGGDSRTIPLNNQFAPGYNLTVAVNVTVLQTENTGYLTLWQTGSTRPTVFSAIWSGTGRAATSMTLVGLRSSDVSFDMACSGAGAATHVVIDLVGYFYKDGVAKARPPVELG